MINQIDILKIQAETLGAYLKLEDGFSLGHSQCLNAIAVIHGHRDWHVVSALMRNASTKEEVDLRSDSSMEAQAKRLRTHLADRYGFTPSESTEVIAAARWGLLVAQANEILGNPVSASQWLRHPHPELGGRTPHELIETDAGYEQISTLLHKA
jgi:uncharacterized protein (DUF2384 family)